MGVDRRWSDFRSAAAAGFLAAVLLISVQAAAAPPGDVAFGVYDPDGDFSEDPDVTIEHVFLPWEDVYLPSLFTADQYALERNRAILVTLEPWTWSKSERNTPERLIAGIQSGEYDHFMRDSCAVIGEFESPTTLRWGHEMDDESGQFIWSDWPPDTFVDAFRKMVTICSEVAPSVRFMWSPLGYDNMADYYPGDEYVDIVGLSAFGHEAWEKEVLGRSQSFEDVFGPRYELAAQFGKPIALTELGYLGSPEYVNRWNNDVRTLNERFPNLTAVIYFNQKEVYEWPDGFGLPDWRIAAKSFAPGSTFDDGPPDDTSGTSGVVLTDGRPEYLVFGEAGSIAQALGLLSDLGVSVLRQQTMASLGNQFLVVDLNGLLTLDDLRDRFAQADIPVTVDANSIFELAAAGDYPLQLIGFDTGSPCVLRQEVAVGIVDGPVDVTNPALRNVTIVSNSSLGEAAMPGSFDHATAIVSLIAARGEVEAILGVAPGSRIFAAVAFEASNGSDIARLENIAKSLDWLVSRDVPIINLSLEGRFNQVLEQIIGLVASRGMILVAAVGNAGELNIAYPAADPNVIAITAIDAAKRQFRNASIGPDVEFSAPGVELLVAAKDGTTIASGTSFAAAIATGLIAQEAQSGTLTTSGIRETFRERSEDLGAKGRDPVFGWGLINSDGC